MPLKDYTEAKPDYAEPQPGLMGQPAKRSIPRRRDNLPTTQYAGDGFDRYSDLPDAQPSSGNTMLGGLGMNEAGGIPIEPKAQVTTDFAPGTRLVYDDTGNWVPTSSNKGRDISDFQKVDAGDANGQYLIPKNALPQGWQPGMKVRYDPRSMQYIIDSRGSGGAKSIPPTTAGASMSKEGYQDPVLALQNNAGNGNTNTNDIGQNDQRNQDYRPPGFTYDTGQLPGGAEGINYDTTNDYYNAILSAVTSRDDFDTGGNSLTEDGQWNSPDWLRGVDTELTEDRLNGLMRGDSEYLNIARDRANEQAAEQGMLGSSVAAGNAVRSMREAALPIAQADADAINRGRLQSQGLMANAYDSASDRRWRSREANTERATQLIRDELGFRRSVLDREDRQTFDYMNREDSQNFDAWQNELTREFQDGLESERLNWEGDQRELDRTQQRRMAYYEVMFGREGLMGNVLNSIYSNPNLTPEQARSAAENARGLFEGLWRYSNDLLADGIPEIIENPYQMEDPGAETVGPLPDETVGPTAP